MSDRFKRIIAFIIDWNLTLLPLMCISSVMALIIRQQSSAHPIIGLIFFLLMIGSLALFISRDALFKGRSLGKRIFKLYVLNKTTMSEPTLKQKLLRNVFFFIYTIDGIILLATGESLGDRAAGTVVLSQKTIDDYNNPQPNPENAALTQKKKNQKIVIILIVVLVVGLIAFTGFIQMLLNLQKNTEEYKVAYNYLVTSEAFEELNVSESKIRMNQYSSRTSLTENTQTVEIGFLVNFKSFEVVCHKENDVWTVCEDCTNFE